MDDGGINLDWECEFDKMDKPYEDQSPDSAEYPRSSSVKIDSYREIFKRSAKLLPENVKVILLADRAFGNPEFVRLCPDFKLAMSSTPQIRYLGVSTETGLANPQTIAPLYWRSQADSQCHSP